MTGVRTRALSVSRVRDSTYNISTGDVLTSIEPAEWPGLDAVKHSRAMYEHAATPTHGGAAITAVLISERVMARKMHRAHVNTHAAAALSGGVFRRHDTPCSWTITTIAA